MKACVFIDIIIVCFAFFSTIRAVSRPLFVPKNITGIKGGSLTLTCIPPNAIIAHPTILWGKTTERGSENIASSVSGVPHISSSFLSGRSFLKGGNLTISSLQIADSGVYTCTVTAIQTPTQSASAQMIITATPKLSAAAEENPRIGENNTYIAATCVAESGQPKPSVRWTDDTGKVQSSKELTVSNSDGSTTVRSQLILTPGLSGRTSITSQNVILQKKVKEFICEVEHENLIEVRQKIRKVSVNLLYSPFAYISLLGNRLMCHAEGNPRPSVSWLHHDGIVSNTSEVYLKDSEAKNGFYSCHASSILKPDSIATLDVQRTRDLPVLFRTLVKLNTSLPTTASGYEITCSAEVENWDELNHTIGFEWMRNGHKLTRKTYQVRSDVVRIKKSLKNRLLSTLRFIDVVRGRDDAEFQCRLVNRTQVTGFVSAVERSVLVSVDYAPSEVSITGDPKDFTVVEGKLLTLHCSSNSQPPSVKEWYFDNVKIATGGTLQVNNIARSESGLYRCLAYNYVPGSAHADAKVTVVYHPSNLKIRKKSGNKLSCEAKGGSNPPPIYFWIFPNQSIIRGNRSEVHLLSPSTHKQRYVCLATNNLGVSINATYDQLPAQTGKIGSLSVTNFSITLTFCIIFGVALFGGLGYLIYKRKCKSRSAEETFKRYLNYTGSPKTNSASSAEQNNNHTSGHVTELPDQSNHNTSTDMDEKQPALPKLCDKSYKCSENFALECTPIAVPPTSCVRSLKDFNTPQSHSTKQFVDGSSIEITAIDSLASSTNQLTEQASSAKSNETKTFDSEPSATTSQNQTDETESNEEQTRSCTLPCSARLASIRRDVARHMNRSPYQHLPRGGMSHIYHPRHPLQIHHPPQMGLVVSNCDPLLFNATWRPTTSSCITGGAYSVSEAEAMKDYCNPNRFEQTHKRNCRFETQKSFLEENRPRSMSLSGSSTSNKSYSNLVDEDVSHISEIAKDFKIPVDRERKDSLTAALPQFNNGDEAKKLFLTTNNNKKHQSVSLV